MSTQSAVWRSCGKPDVAHRICGYAIEPNTGQCVCDAVHKLAGDRETTGIMFTVKLKPPGKTARAVEGTPLSGALRFHEAPVQMQVFP